MSSITSSPSYSPQHIVGILHTENCLKKLAQEQDLLHTKELAPDNSSLNTRAPVSSEAPFSFFEKKKKFLPLSQTIFHSYQKQHLLEEKMGSSEDSPFFLKKKPPQKPYRELATPLLEIRLDALPWYHFDAYQEWPLPVIATARAPQEGGRNNLSLRDRQRLLEGALPWASLLDIELSSTKDFSTLMEQAHKKQCPLILSYHNYQTVPSLRQLKELVTQAHHLGASIVKIATLTQTEEELQRLLAFQQLPHPLPVATMGMGLLGKISRLYLATLGTKLLYTYLYTPLDDITASHQWSTHELCTALYST